MNILNYVSKFFLDFFEIFYQSALSAWQEKFRAPRILFNMFRSLKWISMGILNYVWKIFWNFLNFFVRIRISNLTNKKILFLKFQVVKMPFWQPGTSKKGRYRPGRKEKRRRRRRPSAAARGFFFCQVTYRNSYKKNKFQNNFADII